MSCFSAPPTNTIQKTKLLEEKLKKLIGKFHHVRFPLIINEFGEIVCTLISVEDIPTDLGSYVVSAKSLSEKVLKLLCSSNGRCRQMKVKGENSTVFNLLCLDERHVLVFFFTCEEDYELITEPATDESVEEVLNEIRLIINSSVNVV